MLRMPRSTTPLSIAQEDPDLPQMMIVTTLRLMSQQHFNGSLSAHLKKNVKTIMYWWGNQKQEDSFTQAKDADLEVNLVSNVLSWHLRTRTANQVFIVKEKSFPLNLRPRKCGVPSSRRQTWITSDFLTEPIPTSREESGINTSLKLNSKLSPSSCELLQALQRLPKLLTCTVRVTVSLVTEFYYHYVFAILHNHCVIQNNSDCTYFCSQSTVGLY